MKAYGSKRVLGSPPNGPKSGAMRNYGTNRCTCRWCYSQRLYAKTAERMNARLDIKKAIMALVCD